MDDFPSIPLLPSSIDTERPCYPTLLALVVEQGTHLFCQRWQYRVFEQGVKPCEQQRTDNNADQDL